MKYVIILINVFLTMLVAPNLSIAGSEHTSIGGNLIQDPVENSDISEFLHDPNEWARLISIQSNLIIDLQYLIENNLLLSQGNFFQDNMEGNQTAIIRKLKTIKYDNVIAKLNTIINPSDTQPQLNVLIEPEDTSCLVDGRKKSASINFDHEKRKYVVCVDYEQIKEASSKETFHLYLMSLITHELAHIWNDDIGDELAKGDDTQIEIIPTYFQKLVLRYFSHSHHDKARNSIQKLYTWSSETFNDFLRLSQFAYARPTQIGSPDSRNATMITQDEKINFMCKNHLRGEIFPSEWIQKLSSIRNLFLSEGLIEIAITDFANVTKVFYRLLALNDFCSKIQNNQLPNENSCSTGKSDDKTFEIKDEEKKTNNYEQYYLPPPSYEESDIFKVNRRTDFYILLWQINKILRDTYLSQKTYLSLM